MYSFIDDNRGNYPVEMMARLLKISSRSYYNYTRGIYSFRELKREELEWRIQQVYAQTKGRYGSPRIAAEITAGGYAVSANTVCKYMKRMGLRSKLSCRHKAKHSYEPHSLCICPNHLERNFTVDAPGKAWVSDITYIRAKENFVYLTTVIDLYDRKVIGWSLSDNLTAKDTCVKAFQMAIKNRKVSEGMIFHSDRGVQYACEEFRNQIKGKIVQSMSRKGNCWDNAVAESFFRNLKCEMIYGNKTLTAKEMEIKIFEYIEIWYNKKRRHSALENLTMDEFWSMNKNCA
jgi:transposase InsO family protein